MPTGRRPALNLPLTRLGLVAMAALLAACTTTTPDQRARDGNSIDGMPDTGATAASTPDRPAARGTGRPAMRDGAGAAAGSSGKAPVVTRPDGRVTLPGTEADEAGRIADAETATLEIEPPTQGAHPDRDLWQRIRDGFAFPPLDTNLVEQKKRFYLERPEYLQRMFTRGSRYLYYIVEEVERRGMPTELALLPFVESAMNPVAMSSAKASGLWQFIPATGKRFDLEQNWWADNRRDVVQSTDAALEYLQTIYTMHGNDWFLALASYNWGEGAVARSVKRNRANGQPTDYLSIRMPTETRHYVPKLIAMKEIIRDADKLGVELPPLPDEPYFVLVRKTRPIDLKLAAQFANMSVDDFVALNPAHNRPVIQATEDSMLKIPADRLDGFVAAMARHEADEKVFATWHPYTLKSGETLESVAHRGGVTAAELRRANSIAPEARVLAGTLLLTPQKSVTDETAIASFTGARIYQQVNVPATYHVVRRRETAATIARRHGLTVRQLAAFNGGRSSYRPGQRLTVRHAQTQTVLINENGARRLISSQSGGPAAHPAAATASASGPAAMAAGAATAAAAATRTAPGPTAAGRETSAQTPPKRAASTAAAAPAKTAASRPASSKAASSKAASSKAASSRTAASNPAASKRPATKATATKAGASRTAASKSTAPRAASATKRADPKAAKSGSTAAKNGASNAATARADNGTAIR